jgi:hypothetical protein
MHRLGPEFIRLSRLTQLFHRDEMDVFRWLSPFNSGTKRQPLLLIAGLAGLAGLIREQNGGLCCL